MYRPAKLHRLEKSIPWNRFLGSLNIYKYELIDLAVVKDRNQNIFLTNGLFQNSIGYCKSAKFPLIISFYFGMVKQFWRLWIWFNTERKSPALQHMVSETQTTTQSPPHRRRALNLRDCNRTHPQVNFNKLKWMFESSFLYDYRHEERLVFAHYTYFSCGCKHAVKCRWFSWWPSL